MQKPVDGRGLLSGNFRPMEGWEADTKKFLDDACETPAKLEEPLRSATAKAIRPEERRRLLEWLQTLFADCHRLHAMGSDVPRAEVAQLALEVRAVQKAIPSSLLPSRPRSR